MNSIHCNVKPEWGRLVERETTAKALWNKLIDLTSGTGYVKAMRLFQKVARLMDARLMDEGVQGP